MLLSKTLNPFADSSNFSFTALRDTTSPELDHLKVANAADPKVPASLQHAFYEGTEFLDEHKGTVEKIIEEQRANMDLPFDELYHAQKKVIQDVIDAEKALQEKVDSLPDPAKAGSLDMSRVTAEQRGELQEILDQLESPFIASQKRRKEAILDAKLKKVQAGSHTGAYKFDYSETTDLKQKLSQGLVTPKQSAQIK